MLDKSFALAGNLLDSGHYYPKRMLLQYAQKEPENTRRLFIELYSEDKNLIDRLEYFRTVLRKYIKHISLKKRLYDKPGLFLYQTKFLMVVLVAAQLETVPEFDTSDFSKAIQNLTI